MSGVVGFTPLTAVSGTYKIASDAPHTNLHDAIATAVNLIAAAVPTRLSELTDDVDLSGVVPTGSQIVLARNPSTNKWNMQIALSSTGGADPYFAKTVFEAGAPAITGATDDAGLMALSATVIDTLEAVAEVPPTTTATIMDVYLRGPSNNWAALTTPVATLTFSVPVGGGSPARLATQGGLAIVMQRFDSLVSRIRSADATAPAGNITLIAHKNLTATIPTQVGPPTGVTSNITGQPNNTVLVSWSAPTIPVGHTPGNYTVVCVQTSQTQTVAFGTNFLSFLSLPASPLTFYVFLTTTVSSTTLAGVNSAVTSPAVTPNAASTNRLSANEQKGADWQLNSGAGAATVQSGVSVTGSGQTGSLLIGASGWTTGGIDVGTTGRHSVTPGEVKNIGAWFKNNSSVAVLVSVWVSFQNTLGAYAGDSAVRQDSVAPGAIYHFTNTATTPSGVVTGILAAQMIPNSTADSVSMSGDTWDV